MGKQLQGHAACAAELVDARAQIGGLHKLVDGTGPYDARAVVAAFACTVAAIEGLEAVVRALLMGNTEPQYTPTLPRDEAIASVVDAMSEVLKMRVAEGVTVDAHALRELHRAVIKLGLRPRDPLAAGIETQSRRVLVVARQLAAEIRADNRTDEEQVALLKAVHDLEVLETYVGNKLAAEPVVADPGEARTADVWTPLHPDEGQPFELRTGIASVRVHSGGYEIATVAPGQSLSLRAHRSRRPLPDGDEELVVTWETPRDRVVRCARELAAAVRAETSHRSEEAALLRSVIELDELERPSPSETGGGAS